MFPELDVFATLCAVYIATALWNSRRIALRVAMALLLVVALRPSWRYLKHAYVEFPRDPGVHDPVEYKTSRWLIQNGPDERTFVTGTIPFWYNAWFDGQQTDGGSQQGLLNFLLPTVQWYAASGDDPDIALYTLQATATDIVVVPGATSQEHYKDFVHPEIYATRFPLVRDDGEGNRYYRVPRRNTGIIRVIDRSRVKSVAAILPHYVKPQIQAYADAVEAPPPGGP